MKNRSSHSYLAFKGWWVDGPELRVQVRMCSSTSRSTWVEHGPVYTVIVPTSRLLDEDVTNAAAWAQHHAEVAERIAQVARDAAAQDPLF